LRIVVVEAEVAGFGASGRNGGWCSGLFPVTTARLAATGGRAAGTALRQAMRDTVDEIGEVIVREGIGCDYAKGGTVSLIRSSAQRRRALDELAQARLWGSDDTDLDLLGAEEARARLAATDIQGALYTPHCAVLHPARLVRGLAQAVERMGVRIVEQTRARAVEPHRVVTDRGLVRADAVIRATEGYTPGLAGQRRNLAPVYSLMIATEPLSDAMWERIGLRRRETFTDLRHLIIYGQRTADGRIAFGGRGAPYHFGSRVQTAYDRETRVFAHLRETLVGLLPLLRDVRITHAWGGPLGIARDWCPSVGFDPLAGVGWGGGYVGKGVGVSNLAGRTLADLILQRETPRTRLPWVGHRSPAWEPEPLRWLGINAGLRLMTTADAEERLTGRPSLLARAVSPLLRGH